MKTDQKNGMERDAKRIAMVTIYDEVKTMLRIWPLATENWKKQWVRGQLATDAVSVQVQRFELDSIMSYTIGRPRDLVVMFTRTMVNGIWSDIQETRLRSGLLDADLQRIGIAEFEKLVEGHPGFEMERLKVSAEKAAKAAMERAQALIREQAEEEERRAALQVAQLQRVYPRSRQRFACHCEKCVSLRAEAGLEEDQPAVAEAFVPKSEHACNCEGCTARRKRELPALPIQPGGEPAVMSKKVPALPLTPDLFTPLGLAREEPGRRVSWQDCSCDDCRTRRALGVDPTLNMAGWEERFLETLERLDRAIAQYRREHMLLTTLKV